MRVLVLQRKDDPNFWQSVTGTMETDEDPYQTACREVHEEIGVDVSNKNYQVVDARIVSQYSIRPEWQYRYGPGTTVNTEYLFYLQIHSSEDIVLTEHLQFQWLPMAEAAGFVWSPSNKEAIQALFNAKR